MTSKPFTTFLWFDTQSEEAARYYVSIFKNSRLGDIHRYTSAGPGEEGGARHRGHAHDDEVRRRGPRARLRGRGVDVRPKCT